MKKFKKLLALMMVLAMSVMVFAACEDDDKDAGNSGKAKTEDNVNDDNSVAVNPANDAKATVEAFLDAYTTLDFADALNYIEEDSYFYADFGSSLYVDFDVDIDDIGRRFDYEDFLVDMYAEMIGSNYMDDLARGLVQLIRDECSYKIKDVEVDGDTATVLATITSVDMTSIDLSGLDTDSVPELLDLDDDDYEAFAVGFVEYIMDDLGITDVSELDYYLDDESLIMYTFGYMDELGLLSTYFDNMLDNVSDNLEINSVDTEFELELIDGEWLIVDSE